MPDLSEYKVGVVLTAIPCVTKGKPLKACTVNVGVVDQPITVVTAAPNVREGSRVAVAPVGSKFESDAGEEIVVKKTSVGGVMSEGVFCDSRMLGWIGGSQGVAAQMPESLDIGSAPPGIKPIGVTFKEKEPEIPAVEVKPLFERKLTKEEKKRLAEEKKLARKAAKEAKKQAEES